MPTNSASATSINKASALDAVLSAYQHWSYFAKSLEVASSGTGCLSYLLYTHAHRLILILRRLLCVCVFLQNP